MRRPRTLFTVLAAVIVAVAATLLVTGGSSAAPTKSQALFAKMLLADAKTTSDVKQLLSEGGGFVAPDITFEDLTGDGRSDAIVLVETGGVASAVALYVFSTDGEPAESDLRVVYRSQRLYQAGAEVADATLILSSPRFVEGDDVCCPAKIVQRTYVWSAGSKTLRQRSSQELPGPTE